MIPSLSDYSLKKYSVSVVIPCRNEEHHIESCVHAVFENISDDLEVEILVVEGNSSDKSLQVLEQIALRYSCLKIISNPQGMTPVAFNLGIKESKMPFVAVTGARSRLDPDYLITCIRILESKPGTGCVGGRLVPVSDSATSNIISNALSSPFGIGSGNSRVSNVEGPCDTVASPVFRRVVFDEVGYFDEDLLRNQDDDFSYRIRRRGYDIWCTQATRIYYTVRSGFQKLSLQYFQYGYWKVLVNRKHRAFTTLRQLVPPLFVVFLLTTFFTPFFKCFLICWSITLAVYLALSFLFSVRTGTSLLKLPALMYTFFLLHTSYGLGYWKGIWHFGILGRKKGSKSGSRLSR